MTKADLTVYLWCVLGIVISIVLPILRGLLPKPPPPPGVAVEPVSFLTAFIIHAKPYLVVGAFSLLTGFLIVALAHSSLTDYRAALLAGYAWDSTLQKLTKP